jgi:Ca2+-binding RTX toxin-like protein
MGRAGARFSVAFVSATVGVALLALAALPASAPAAITADPVVKDLFVKGDADANQIQVDCRSGVVLVNGAATEGASCAELEKLAIVGFGGDDTISLTGFRKVGKPGLALFEADGEDEGISISAAGGDGNDSVAGDAPGQGLIGGAGNDTLRSLAPFSFLIGAAGSDRVLSDSVFNFSLGGRGADVIRAGPGLSFSSGGKGDDLMRGGSGVDIADGGDGRDTLVGRGGPDFLGGLAGADKLFGGTGGDVLAGFGGRDRLRGGPGDDLLFQRGLPRRRIEEVLEKVLGDIFGPSETVEAVVSARRLFN